MNKRIKNKKAKQISIKIADQFSKIRTIEPIGFYKKLSENHKFEIGGQVTAYFNNPKAFEIMQKRQIELNEFIKDIVDEQKNPK